MNNLIEYLIKSGACLAVLYFLYWLALRNDTHFRLNRIVLLGSVGFSLIIPLFSLSLPSTIQTSIPILNVMIDETVIPVQAIRHSLTIWQAISWIYITGAIIVACRLIYQAIYLYVVSKLSGTIQFKDLTVVLMNAEISPFSYFSKIYIPANKADDYSLQGILEHEKSHKEQGHFIDLFIIEIVTILQWFNPIVWFYERSIKEVHEYLADEAVLKNGYNQGKYQALLINEAIGGPVFILTNQFNQSIIKKRIIMMKKMKTSRLAKLKTLMFIPLVAALLMAFSNPRSISQSMAGNGETIISGKVTDKITGKSLSDVLVVFGNTKIGTITDANGKYSIKVPADKGSFLQFSYIGYRTEQVAVGNSVKIDIQLEEKAVAIDPANESKAAPESQVQTQNSTSDVYIETEINPTYPGGMEALKNYLMATVQYPEEARKKGIEGKVYVQFVITKDGKITDAIIKRGVNEALDKEALRVVNTFPDWTPGIQGGKAVNAQVTLPIEFKL
jgi:TonB family protein